MLILVPLTLICLFILLKRWHEKKDVEEKAYGI